MLNIQETLELAHRLLEDAKINHALIGGLALGHYGVHRATVDVDFLVAGEDKQRLKSILIEGAFELKAETDEVLHFAGQGNLDVLLANRPATHAMLERATATIKLSLKCLDAEDLIGLKIQAYKNNPKRLLQDQADIAALIRQNENLDWDRIKSYADLFNEWDNVQELKHTHGGQHEF